jgi:hypothetical protein
VHDAGFARVIAFMFDTSALGLAMKRTARRWFANVNPITSVATRPGPDRLLGVPRHRLDHLGHALDRSAPLVFTRRVKSRFVEREQHHRSSHDCAP